MRIRRHSSRSAFTLVEVLIVVVILGILAATVVPQFTGAGEDAKEAALVQDLQTFRSQIELFRFQHNGAFPGSGAETFEDQMLLSSKTDGTTGPIGTHPYGPYFIGALPPNPFNGKRGIAVDDTDVTTITPGPSVVDGDGNEAGWIYDFSTGRIKANTSGTSNDGVTAYDEL